MKHKQKTDAGEDDDGSNLAVRNAGGHCQLRFLVFVGIPWKWRVSAWNALGSNEFKVEQVRERQRGKNSSVNDDGRNGTLTDVICYYRTKPAARPQLA